MRKLFASIATAALALMLLAPATSAYTFERGKAVPEPVETGITFCVLAWVNYGIVC
jgi:hypothetical protein